MSKHFHWARTFLGLALLGAGIAGCGEDPVSGTADFATTPPEMLIDLESETGGLGIQDEAASFGDDFFRTHLGEDLDRPVTDDPLLEDARLRDAETRPETEVFYVRVVWGNHRRGPETTDDATRSPITTWDGAARVTDGVMMALRTIRFERGDALVPPWRQENPSRQRVQWISRTAGGRDGVLLKIVVPVDSDRSLDDLQEGARDGLTADDQFIFRTGPLQIAFPLDGIEDLDETVMIDDQIGVSFTGFDRDDIQDACPRGYMVGGWVTVRDDDYQGGYFRAKWVNPVGALVGHVRGRWGVRENGDRVFVGKIISVRGRYLGHLRGTWERSEADPSRGTYHGGWIVYGADGETPRAVGGVRGMWAASDRVDGGGFLRGVWAAECNRGGDRAE